MSEDSTMEIINLVQSVAAEIRVEMGKLSDKMDHSHESAHQNDIKMAKHDGMIEAITLVQTRHSNDIVNINKTTKTISFFMSNPAILKATALGFGVMMAFTLWSGYVAVSKFIREDNNGKIEIERVQSK